MPQERKKKKENVLFISHENANASSSRAICHNLPTVEIRLKLFGSPDPPDFLVDFRVTGTPFTHLQTFLKFWGLPRKCV